MKRITLQRIQREVRKISGDDDDNNLANQASVVLLSAIQVGTSVRALAQFTNLPRATVAKFVRKAREQEIFTRTGKIQAEWFGEHGGIALIADSLVLCGLMNRAKQGVERTAVSG